MSKPNLPTVGETLTSSHETITFTLTHLRKINKGDSDEVIKRLENELDNIKGTRQAIINMLDEINTNNEEMNEKIEENTKEMNKKLRQ